MKITETQDYRATLIETLGFFGDRAVIDESFKRFESYREDPSSLALNLRSAVIAIVGRYSSRSVFRELLSMAASTRSVEEKRMYLRGLGAALDPETARETLEYLVSGTIKPDDMYWALKYFSAEGEHADIAWSFASCPYERTAGSVWIAFSELVAFGDRGRVHGRPAS